MLNSNGNSDFDRFCFNSKNANSVVGPIQSNMSVHHYECVALCFVNILQRARS